MPRVVAPVGAATSEDLGDVVQDTVRKAHQVLNAKAVATMLEGLGIGGSGSSGDSSMAKALGEAFGGIASGLKGMGELQTALIGQVKDLLGGRSSGGSISELVGLALVLKLLSQDERKGSAEELSPAMQRLLDRMEEEIRELKSQRGPGPVEQQFQQAMMQIAGQTLTMVSDPFAGLARLSEARDKLRAILGHDGTPPEYSEGALRARAIAKEEKALEVDQEKHLADLSYRERVWSQRLPAIIQMAGQVLAQNLAAFGLIQTQPLRFDQGAQAAADAAMAAADQA